MRSNLGQLHRNIVPTRPALPRLGAEYLLNQLYEEARPQQECPLVNLQINKRECFCVSATTNY